MCRAQAFPAEGTQGTGVCKASGEERGEWRVERRRGRSGGLLQ